VFRLASSIPERITRGIIVNGMVPPDYVTGKKVRSRWTRSLMSATAVSSPVATLILGVGKQLMLRIGVEKFLLKMYGHAPSDRAVARDTAVSQSIAEGAEYVTMQGLNAGAVDMIEGFADWRGEVGAAQIACTLVHGAEDPHVPIIAVRAMAAEFPDRLDLIEVPDGGGLLNYTHTDKLFDLVAAHAQR
jgi:pimeloyl-ACP methyl ester carboxylesterase